MHRNFIFLQNTFLFFACISIFDVTNINIGDYYVMKTHKLKDYYVLVKMYTSKSTFSMAECDVKKKKKIKDLQNNFV